MGNQSYADSGSHLKIKQAALSKAQSQLVLNAEVDIDFSDEIEQALRKGFTLRYLLEFQLALPVKYWFNDEIVTITEKIDLSYHPLARQFLVVQDGVGQSFQNLDSVAKAFKRIQPVDIIALDVLEKDAPYEAVLLMRLDVKALPKTLQERAANSSAWDMTSQRYEWKPELFK